MVEKSSLSPSELQVKLDELLPKWRTGQNPKGVDYIERVKHAADYLAGIRFVSEIAELAEANNHHPEIHINYKRISVKYWTHSSRGVTLADVQMAQKIDHLF